MAGCVVREGRIRMDGWILSSEGFATTGCGGGWIALHCTALPILYYGILRYATVPMTCSARRRSARRMLGGVGSGRSCQI